MMTFHPRCQYFRLTFAKQDSSLNSFAGRQRSALLENEPSGQSILIANSSVVGSVYIDLNQVETFDNIGRRLCLVKFRCHKEHLPRPKQSGGFRRQREAPLPREFLCHIERLPRQK